MPNGIDGSHPPSPQRYGKLFPASKLPVVFRNNRLRYKCYAALQFSLDPSTVKFGIQRDSRLLVKRVLAADILSPKEQPALCSRRRPQKGTLSGRFSLGCGTDQTKNFFARYNGGS